MHFHFPARPQHLFKLFLNFDVLCNFKNKFKYGKQSLTWTVITANGILPELSLFLHRTVIRKHFLLLGHIEHGGEDRVSSG